MGRISEYLESCHSSLGQVVMACFLTMTLAIPSNFAPILAAGNVDESIDIEAPVDTEPNAKPVVESVTGEEATPVVEGKATDGLNVDVEWIDSAFDMKDLVFTEGKNIVWESDKTSTKRFTMRINYSDANCTNGYDAGGLEIRVPLVAELSDDLIFADSNLSNPTHDFNWSYSNPRPDGTQDLVLRNNHAIPAGNNFTGTIQVIWQITNRGADRQWAIQAVSTATDKIGNTYEITGENTLTLAIRNTKDVFAPTFTTSKITDISHMEEGWRDYIWVQYKFAPGQSKKTMPLSDGMYIFDIPSDCVVYNDGSLSPSTDTATPEQLPIFEYPYNASLTGNQGTGVIRSDGSLVLHLYYSYKAYNAAIWGAAPETVTPPSDVIPGITKVYDAYGSTSAYTYVATNNATDFTYKRRNAGKGLPNNSAFRVRITVPTARTLAVYTSISAYSSSQKPTARGVWYKWNGVEWVSVRTTRLSSSGSMNYNATEPGYYMFEGSEPSVRNSGDYISFRISKLS